MMHVEAVTKMLDLNRIAVKRRQANRWFKRGTLYRKPLDVLRTAEQPMTATDIAWKMLTAYDVKDADKAAAQTVAQRIQHSLMNHVGKGVQKVGEARPMRWTLTDKG
jgi:hypothetical protein